MINKMAELLIALMLGAVMMLLAVHISGSNKQAQCEEVPKERTFKTGEFVCLRKEHNEDWSSDNHIGCGYLYFHE